MTPATHRDRITDSACLLGGAAGLLRMLTGEFGSLPGDNAVAMAREWLAGYERSCKGERAAVAWLPLTNPKGGLDEPTRVYERCTRCGVTRA